MAKLISDREVVVVGDAIEPSDFVAATGAAAEAAARF